MDQKTGCLGNLILLTFSCVNNCVNDGLRDVPVLLLKTKKQSDPWKLDSHLESNLFSPSEISWFTRGKLINTQFKHQFSVKMMG